MDPVVSRFVAVLIAGSRPASINPKEHTASTIGKAYVEPGRQLVQRGPGMLRPISCSHIRRLLVHLVAQATGVQGQR